MELGEAIAILDDENIKHWIYKQTSTKLETAIAVILATARVVHEERERVRAQRREP